MNIYKLVFKNKKEAELALISKEVIDENFNYINGTQAVVEVGLIVLTNGTYDDNGDVITEPIYADGYHFDIMSLDEVDFGINQITPNNPKHSFAGFETIELDILDT